MVVTGIKITNRDDLELFRISEEHSLGLWSVETWKRAYDEGFGVDIPGKGEVVVKKEFLLFEKGMSLSGKAVETINIPGREITVFIEKK